MAANRHPKHHLSKLDVLIVNGGLTVAFVLILAHYFPAISLYDAWPMALRIIALIAIPCALAFVAGYWTKGKLS